MSSSLRPETNTRYTQKCSACRRRKKKVRREESGRTLSETAQAVLCSPHERDWELSGQRCDYCETRGLPCGPNFRCGDDPAINRRRRAENANALRSDQARDGDTEGSIVCSAADVTLPPARRTGGNDNGPPNVSRAEDGRELLSVPSIKDLEAKASSKLDEFHALGSTLAYVSQPAFPYCHAHEPQQPHHDLSIEEKLHELFIYIQGIAIEANARNEHPVARWILFALMSALDKYPRLFDHRKRHILLKIAQMFQELGHRWDCEHILLKVVSMHKMSALPSPDDPFHLLSTSYPISSTATKRTLEDRWNETVGGSLIDSNLNLPPLHVAVQHRSPGIIAALLPNPSDCLALQSDPSLHMSSNVVQMSVDTEERDLYNRTALFAAVVNGDEACCLSLILHGANVNTRDGYGHTALEVAVRRRHLNMVKTLIEYKADVNPDITKCSSLPLHAAIENFQLDIIHHLLNSGAEVNLRRYVDNKNAIDLAADRGYHELAEVMQGMIPSLDSTPFMIRDSSMSQIVP